jgi:hypothetical protein
MQLFLGLLTPKRLMEQTTSQSLQPEHRSGITVNFLDTPFLLTVEIVLLGDSTQRKQFVNLFQSYQPFP